MRIYFFIIASVVCLFSFSGKAQILAPPEGMQFTRAPKFNPAFVTENGIREIRAVMETKEDGDKIRKTHRNLVYQFDEEGRSSLLADIHTKRRDTSITAFQFAGRRLLCEVKSDPAGLFSYCYVYGDDGLPTERKYARIERWRNLTKPDFSGKDTKVATETYTHARYENQLHTTLHNSAGRPYQKEIRYYDDNGYLLKYLRTFVMTSERHEEVYNYEAYGRVKSVEVTAGRNLGRTEFTYDEVGNLLTEERFENATLVYHREFVYEGADMLLRAELTRREAEEMLEIITYTYRFR